MIGNDSEDERSEEESDHVGGAVDVAQVGRVARQLVLRHDGRRHNCLIENLKIKSSTWWQNKIKQFIYLVQLKFSDRW